MIRWMYPSQEQRACLGNATQRATIHLYVPDDSSLEGTAVGEMVRWMLGEAPRMAVTTIHLSENRPCPMYLAQDHVDAALSVRMAWVAQDHVASLEDAALLTRMVQSVA